MSRQSSIVFPLVVLLAAGCEPELVERIDTITPINCDADGDGVDAVVCGGSDCDDDNAAIFPGAYEVVGDLIDQDCDTSDVLALEALAIPGDLGSSKWFLGDGRVGGPVDLGGQGIAGVTMSLKDGQPSVASYPVRGALLPPSRRVGVGSTSLELLAMDDGQGDVVAVIDVDDPASVLADIVLPEGELLHSVDVVARSDGQAFVLACSNEAVYTTAFDLETGEVLSTEAWSAASTSCRGLVSLDVPMVLVADSDSGVLTRWRLASDGPFDRLVLATGLDIQALETSSQGGLGLVALIDGGEVAVMTSEGDLRHVGPAGAATSLAVDVREDGASVLSWASSSKQTQVVAGPTLWDLESMTLEVSAEPLGVSIEDGADGFRVLLAGESALLTGLGGWTSAAEQ